MRFSRARCGCTVTSFVRPAAPPPLSLGISLDAEGQGTAYALLARAAGERGDSALFDHAVDIYRDLLDHDSARGILFNPFTFREIHLRGLLATHRPAEAVRLLRIEHPGDQPVAPQ